MKAEQYNMPYDQMSKVVYDYLYKMQNDEVQESNVIHDALHTQQSTNQWQASARQSSYYHRKRSSVEDHVGDLLSSNKLASNRVAKLTAL